MSARPPVRRRPDGQSLTIVVFGPSSLPYLRPLKAGYRHCMVTTQDRGTWHLLDPLSNGLEVREIGAARPDEIIGAFRAEGLDAVAVQRRPPELRQMPLAPVTCVEVVKRVLGLRARRVLTPWQLRRRIAADHRR